MFFSQRTAKKVNLNEILPDCSLRALSLQQFKVRRGSGYQTGVGTKTVNKYSYSVMRLHYSVIREDLVWTRAS